VEKKAKEKYVEKIIIVKVYKEEFIMEKSSKVKKIKKRNKNTKKGSNNKQANLDLHKIKKLRLEDS